MFAPFIAPALASLGAAASVYSTVQQGRTEAAAARQNAEAQRQAAETSSEDARRNALRRQADHRKYLGSLRAKMFADGGGIEGGKADFLNEAVGDLQLKILDASVAENRRQASFFNNAMSLDWQADNIKKATPIAAGSSVLSGIAGVYSTGKTSGAWGYSKAAPKAYEVK